MADGLGSRPWSLSLAIVGIMYGLFGWLCLGVTMDVVLLLGACTLLVRGVTPWNDDRHGITA